MKRTLLISIIALFSTVSVAYGANNLYEYYNGNLPSVEERSQIYEPVFQDEYRGTFTQNVKLLNYLQDNPDVSSLSYSNRWDIYNVTETKKTILNHLKLLFDRFDNALLGGEMPYPEGTSRYAIDEFEKTKGRLGATNTVPETIALFETTITNKISSSATSLTLTSATDKDGTTLASSTYAFIIDEGTSVEEFVLADCTGTACTNVSRGISVRTGTSTVSALQKAHRRGASIKITDAPILPILTNIFTGKQNIPNVLNYSSGVSNTSGNSNELATVGFVETITNQGAATSTEATGGIVELATQIEMASSTDLGADIPLVVQAKYSTSTCDTAGLYNVITENDGKLNQGCLDLTEDFTFTGTTTTNGGTDIQASGQNPVVFNDVYYRFPSGEGASSTALSTDGAGSLTWNTLPDGMTLLTSTTTEQNMVYATTSTFSAVDTLKVFVDFRGISSATSYEMYFNSDAAVGNYGSTIYEDFDVFNDNTAAGGRILLTANSTTSPAFYEIEINNDSSFRKFVKISGAANSSGITLPRRYDGSAVWNDTSAQVTSIVFKAGNTANTLTSGIRISVFGRE